MPIVSGVPAAGIGEDVIVIHFIELARPNLPSDQCRHDLVHDVLQAEMVAARTLDGRSNFRMLESVGLADPKIPDVPRFRLRYAQKQKNRTWDRNADLRILVSHHQPLPRPEGTRQTRRTKHHDACGNLDNGRGQLDRVVQKP